MKLRKYEIMNQVQYLSLEQVKNGVANNAVERYAYIVHDKDTNEDGTPKAPHIHCMVWLKNSYDSKYVAQWFGVQEQYINKIQSDVGAEAYLCHENDDSKYHYPHDAVIANFDWEKHLETEKKAIKDKNRLTDILNQIENGTIRKYNVYDYVSVSEYCKWKRSIDNAFTYRTTKIKGADRTMECIYITGESGVGKTTYAKYLAKQSNYSIYVSSGSNDILDDYAGEDCIILDDLRGSNIGLTDLLKMLDNNTASSVKSRFANKVLECKLIIITTTQDIDSFFAHVFENENETAVQLKRRCKLMIKMTKDKMYPMTWDDENRRYISIGAIPNLVADMYKPEQRTVQEEIERISQVLHLTADMTDELLRQNQEMDILQQKMKGFGNESLPWDI